MATYSTLTPAASGVSQPRAWPLAVRDSANLTCTSTTRPSSPVEGMEIYETDTDRKLVYSGSAWKHIGAIGSCRTWAVAPSLWSPATQNVSAIGGTAYTGQWEQSGRLVVAHMRWNFGGGSAYAGVVGLDFDELPAPAESVSIVGSWLIVRSAGTRLTGLLRYVGGTYGFVLERDGGTNYFADHQANDQLSAHLCYLTAA